MIYYSEKYTTFSPSSTSVLQATSVLVQVDTPGHLGTRDNSSSISYSQANILELIFHNKAQKLSNKWASCSSDKDHPASGIMITVFACLRDD